MKIVILILLAAGFWLIFSAGHLASQVGETLRKTGREMDEASRKRVQKERKRLNALRENRSFLTELERNLYYSGLKLRFPKLTAELFVAGNLVVVALLVIVGSAISGIGLGMCLALLWGMVECLLLARWKTGNLKSVSENLMKLLDFLGNYSITSGEVAGILYQVSKYMEYPLNSVLEACYYEAQTTGDVRTALLQMAEKIEHPKFKELAHNMEVSLRYCADFSALVSGSRRSLMEYLRSARERKGMLREALISMALLLGMSFIILVAVGSLVQMAPMQLLTDTLPGRAGMVAMIVVCLLFAGQIRRVHY